jgi:nitrite reductase/ring-hydroxylating ferredoxin subunit
MDRKEFIKNCGLACFSLVALGVTMESCKSVKYVCIPVKDSKLLVPVSAFEIIKSKEKVYRKYIIVQNDSLQFPICVYRLSASEYHALWMQCTHQNAELQVLGDRLQCSAHGSEFTYKGEVQNGPADKDLRKFPLVIENDFLKISLL